MFQTGSEEKYLETVDSLRLNLHHLHILDCKNYKEKVEKDRRILSSWRILDIFSFNLALESKEMKKTEQGKQNVEGKPY